MENNVLVVQELRVNLTFKLENVLNVVKELIIFMPKEDVFLIDLDRNKYELYYVIIYII